ncbi:unnamed protein product [Phytophthora lilii]|uniref:Unnamed protein product n=1 Tax=Phytophthora lilii TaxID=2077276 RepID=A0A9W6WQ86_9STRA|nr:unnamed protein product [Phytophthora lilii]
MYSQSHAVLSELATSGSDTVIEDSPVKFLNIETIPDVLDWLNNTLVPAVFVTEDSYNEPLPKSEWGRVAMFNQVLGGVSFEVTRMEKRDCKTEAFLRNLYGSCYDPDYTSVYDFAIPYNQTVDEARAVVLDKGDCINASTKLPCLRSTVRFRDIGDEALKPLINSFKYIASLSVLSRLFATAAVFMQGLRVLNTFRNHIGLSMVTRSVKRAICWCGAFAVTFFVVFMAFAVSGAVLFSNRVHEFSLLMTSMKACVNMLFGEFDFGTISDIHYSVAFYWIFMALEAFILLNIVLAIVIDAYNEEKLLRERTKWWRCRRVLANMLMEFATKLIDLLPSCCCVGIKTRRAVVIWGRIRPKLLRQELIVKMGITQDVEQGCEWTPDTVITVEKLHFYLLTQPSSSVRTLSSILSQEYATMMALIKKFIKKTSHRNTFN